MRIIVAATVAASLLAAPPRRKKRTLTLANNLDGYGDRPLPRGRGTLRNRCGDPAYCRAHNFAEVLSFRQVDRATPAVAVAANDCPSGMCDALVAIECSRYAIAIATHPANRPGSPPARR